MNLLRKRSPSRCAPALAHRHSPRLEHLEERNLLSVTLGTGTDGTNFANSSCNCVPPDTIVAVGPTHVMELANSAVAIYTKAGALVSRQSFASFFSSFGIPNADLFDPQVRYDEGAGRWIVGVDDQNSGSKTSQYLIAVSNTSDPTQGFTEQHAINTKETSRGKALWGDFPQLGYNADFYTVSFNMFSFGGGQFSNIQNIRILKSSVVDSNNSTFTTAKTDIAYNNKNFTLIPARQHGSAAGDPVWLVEENGYANGSSIRLVKMTNPGSTSPTMTNYDVTVPSYGSPPAAVSAGNVQMDTGDTRIQSVALRGNRLVVTQEIGLNSLGTARFYEFNVGGATPTLTQAGNIAPGAGIHTSYPSIDISSAGTIGVTYMQMSATQPISMYVAGQLAGGPAGVLQTPQVAQAGLANYTAFDSSPHRAGDYSGIAVDPADGSFWAANEYATAATSNNWGTHIRQFTVDSAASGSAGSQPAAPSSGGTASPTGNGPIVRIHEHEAPIDVLAMSVKKTHRNQHPRMSASGHRTLVATRVHHPKGLGLGINS